MGDQSTGTPTPVTAGAAQVWTSPVFRAALTAFVMSILAIVAHWVPKLKDVNYSEVYSWVEQGTLALTAGAALWALIKRVQSPLNPLTWTKKGAAAHPSTIAVVETQAAMKVADIPTAVTLQQQIEAEQKILKVQSQPE